MRNPTLLMGLLTVSISATAQDAHNVPLVYATASLGGGTHGSIRLGLDVLMHERNSIGGMLLYQTRRTKDAPPDFNYYNAGLFSNEARPFDNYYMAALTYGHMFYTARPERARFHLKAGIIAGSANRAEHYVFIKDPNPGFLFSDEHYEFGRFSHSLFGGILNPVFEVTPKKFVGMSFGSYLILHNYGISAGVDVGVSFGNVRHRNGDYRIH